MGKEEERIKGRLREQKIGIKRTRKNKIRRRKLKNMEQEKKMRKYMSRRKRK